MGKLDNLREYVEEFNTAPTFATMPRKTLEDKGINGPTAAHFIEEIHTPFNYAFLTFTTGTQAFQNITAITPPELPARVRAAKKALELAGIRPGSHLLFTYPPLVTVFTAQALQEYGVNWSFLQASSRDALLLAMCERQPQAVVGESSFLRASLLDADKMDIRDLLPQGVTYLAAGTPLDLDFIPVAKSHTTGTVHDLYGCQEFGWLALDGVPLRDDITLHPSPKSGYFDWVTGGLPTGDCFAVSDKGHLCNPEGKVITYSRVRHDYDLVTTIHASTAAGLDTVSRLARGILRIKGRIVRLAPDLQLNAQKTVLSLAPYEGGKPMVIEGPQKTELFDSLLQAQMDYQAQNKKDPTWIKQR